MVDDEHGLGSVHGKILLEIELKQDQFETVTKRKSTQLLEYLGEVGGLFGTLEIFVAMIG